MNSSKLVFLSLFLFINLTLIGQIKHSSSPDSVSTFGEGIDWWPPNVGVSFSQALDSIDNLDVLTEVCSGSGSDTLFFGDFEFDTFDLENAKILLNIAKRKSGNDITDAYLALTYNGQIISDNLADSFTVWPDNDSTFVYDVDQASLQMDLNSDILNDSSFGFLFTTSPAAFCMNAFINAVNLVVFEDDILMSTVVADAGPDQNFTCVIDSITLGGSNTSMGPEFEYEWRLGTNIVSNEPFYTTTSGGPHVLTVRNTLTGEEAMDTANVGTTFEFIGLGLSTEGELSCSSSNMSITVFTELFYFEETSTLWTTTNGSIISDPTQNTITINQPGEYTVVVTNLESGCTGTETIFIDSNGTAPVINIVVTGPLTCAKPFAILDVTISNTNGAPLVLTWFDENNNILSQEDFLFVEEPGIYTLQVLNTVTGCISEQSQIVTSDQNVPFAIIEGSPFISCAFTTAILDGTSSSAGPEFEYRWTAPDGSIISTENIVEVFECGTYFLTVFNTNNFCESTVAVEVFCDFTEPDVIILQPDPLPFGGTIQLDGSESILNFAEFILYEWTTADGNIVEGGNLEIVTVDAPGTYCLAITNIENGCSTTGCVTVTQEAGVVGVADAGPDKVLTCSKASTILGGPNTSIGPDFTHEWTDELGNVLSTSATIEVDIPGIYTLTVTTISTGEIASDQVIVTVDQEVPFVTIVTPALLSCQVNQVTLESVVAGTGPFEYVWSLNGAIISNEAIISVSEPGTYTLIVIDQSSFCESIVNVEVNFVDNTPTAIVDKPFDLDCDGYITIDTFFATQDTNCVFSWLPQDGLTVDPDNPLTIRIELSGNYTLVKIDTISSCEQLFLFTAIVTDGPLADAGPDVMFNCSDFVSPTIGGPNTSVGDNYAYSWSTSNGAIFGPTDQPTAIPEVDGIYTLMVTDLNTGCMAMDEVEVTSAPQLALDIFLEGEIPCFGSEINVSFSVTGGTPPYTIDWDVPNPNTPLGAGTYMVTVTDSENCFIIQSFTIEEPEELLVDFEINVDGNIEAVVTGGTPPYTFDWNTDDSGPVIENPINGTEYILTLVDANGCEVMNSIVFETNAVLQSKAKQMLLYPNPTNDIVTIESENISSVLQQLEIIDAQGKRMVFSSTFVDSHTMQISFDELNTGTYFIHAIIDDQIFYQKVVLIK